MITMKTDTALYVAATLGHYAAMIMKDAKTMTGDEYMRRRHLADGARKLVERIQEAVWLDDLGGGDGKGGEI